MSVQGQCPCGARMPMPPDRKNLAIPPWLDDNVAGMSRSRRTDDDVTPEGHAFAGVRKTETIAEIETGFAAFLEGAQA